MSGNRETTEFRNYPIELDGHIEWLTKTEYEAIRCESCGGDGMVLGYTCEECHGAGTVAAR